MSEIHQLKLDLRAPTFLKLLHLKEHTGACSMAEVIRRAIDEYAGRVLPVQNPCIEIDTTKAR